LEIPYSFGIIQNGYQHIMKIILNILAFIAVYFLYKVFPFNFNEFYLDLSLNIVLILVMIGIATAIIIEFFLLVIIRPE
jgi:hypothetical protein